MQTDRRAAFKLAAAALATLGAGDALAQDQSQDAPDPLIQGAAAKTDFDYFIGRWRVEHRRLRARLAGGKDWEEFGGETHCQPMFGGLLNLNESISHRGPQPSYGLGIRGFDAARGLWADWTLGAGDLSHIDPPQYGRFLNGVGSFYSRETFQGRPIVVRGQFASITDAEARWEQAFSPDNGATWETNWIMRYLRVG